MRRIVPTDRSTVSGSMGLRAERSYRELSPWFPTEAVVRGAAVQHPHVVATTSDYDDGVAEGTPQGEHHLSHILHLAT